MAKSKGPSLTDILVRYTENKGDRVKVFFSDGRPEQEYNLLKLSDQMILSNVIKNDAGHILKWDQFNSHTTNKTLAMAVDIQQSEAQTKHPVSITVNDGNGHVGNASFSPGFNPLESKNSDEKGKDVFVSEDKKDCQLPVWKHSKDSFKNSMENQGPKIGNYYHVSSGFINSMSNILWYMIVVEFPPEICFIKAGYLVTLFTQYCSDMGIEAPVWMTYFIDVSIRNTSYGPNEYKRGKSRNGQKGHTINHLAFYFTIQTN